MTTDTATSEPVAVSAIPGSAPMGLEESIRSMIGLYRTDDHQYFVNGVGPYYSVTTMLNVMESPELAAWNRLTVAQSAVESYAELGQRIQADGPESATDWLKGAPGRKRDTAATLGTKVHRLADMAARGHQMDSAALGISAGVQPYVDAFMRFLEAYGAANIVSSEKAVISFSERYAGSYDFLYLHPETGRLWLVDVKTGRTVPAKTGMQLAAYGYAEHIVLPNDPNLYPMRRPDHYAVLHLRPDRYPSKGYRFTEWGVEERDYRAFLAARDLWAWRKEGRFRNPTTVIPV